MAKVMFMVDVERPRRDYKRKRFFDGMLGCHTLLEKKEAKRNRRKRLRSTICTIPITYVTKEVTKEKIIKILIPTIKQQLPRDTRTIIIQLDGVSNHNIEHDHDVNREIYDSDLTIKFKKQPPKNTDLNLLDLGYFNNIQGLQYKKEFETVNYLFSNIIEFYD